MINELIDNCFNVKNNTYTINKVKDVMLLKKITIKKKPFLYSLLGGMWYSKDKFSFDQNISLPYPFTTYYTIKIPDITYENKICRSLIYIKTPIFILQFKEKCIAINFNPIISINKNQVYPFICLNETDEHYEISFYLFPKFILKKKKNAWLGFGKNEQILIDMKEHDTFQFSAEPILYKSWQDAILTIFKSVAHSSEKSYNTSEIFHNAKKALFRSYDNLTGSFLQLPWQKTPGFTFVNSSYSILSYEAARLEYFSKWYSLTNDEQFKVWSNKLRNLFINPNLYTIPKKKGKGIIWYNMTNLTKKGLTGYFYMDCGYSGYPGGQASIAYHLLKYLDYVKDGKIKKMVEQSLQYIISTQQENGSWPMAIKQGGIMKYRPEKLSNYITSGGTGESVRALLNGYKLFKNEEMKDAAIKALKFLSDDNPICYNGLRDIGIQEPEAFSSISIINAFLDGYDVTKKQEYLDSALNYTYYLLPWIYLYDSGKLKTSFNFHPISYSITPRQSPYETIWLVATFNRLLTYNNDSMWSTLSKKCFENGIQFITKNNGLCEGVFQDYFKEFHFLPMEQTFATTELMNASFINTDISKLKKQPQKVREIKDKHLIFKKQNDELILTYNKEIILKLNLKKLKITDLKDIHLNEHKISFSFHGPYLIKNKMLKLIKKQLRGKFGKILLGIGTAKYFVKGVYGPKPKENTLIDPFENHIKKYNVKSIKHSTAKVDFISDFHKISISISAILKSKKIHIEFNPVTIEILDHDLVTNKVIFPIVGSKLLKQKDNILVFDGFELKSESKSIINESTFFGIDQTLETNWTHGGIYYDSFEIILKT